MKDEPYRVTYFSLKAQSDKSVALFPFYRDGAPLLHGADDCAGCADASVSSSAPETQSRAPYSRCAVTLLRAGSMRFRWNEVNNNRAAVFSSFGINPSRVTPLELIHSQKVVTVKESTDTRCLCADGILTVNKTLVPTVTVADCVPIYLYEPKTGAFCMLHSGRKGTGIVSVALKAAFDAYGAKPCDFCAVIGPHIQSCCYTVDAQRAAYFTQNFGSACVQKAVTANSANPDASLCAAARDESPACTEARFADAHRAFPYRLSLATANLYLLQKAGVRAENVAVCTDCTCCTAPTVFGSNRRQTASAAPNLSIEERSKLFTPMAAFIYFAE